VSLSDHLRAASGSQDDDGEGFGPAPARSGSDAIAALKGRTRDALLNRLGSRLYDPSLSPTQLNQQVVEELGKVLDRETIPLTPAERDELVAEISDDVLGYGPLEKFLSDPTVTEVMVNGADAIYVERGGKLYRTDERFGSDARLRQVIDKIVSAIGRRIDESSPMVDARLADGSRVNAVIPPLAIDGPALTIRKFAKHRLSADDLIGFGTLTAESTEFLHACVAGRLNVLISGGTGSGKTTLLNVMSSLIPENERIVTIEDAAELQLDQQHLIRLESRPENIEGRGGVTIRDLVRNALRMRPDRIIVGEVRGAETLDMLQAMNTGHDGSLSTVHANSPRDALFRLETMTLMAGLDLPLRAIRDQISSALDLVVHLSRLRDGSRRVTQIAEVAGAEGDVISLSDIFGFDYAAGLDDEGRHLGALVPTGLRPGFAERLRDAGIELPARLLGIDAPTLARPGTRR
jgi:pilus assembly protein CpaF